MKTAQEIAEFVGGTLHGRPDEQITSLDSLEGAREGSIAYADATHREHALSSEASCLLVSEASFPHRTVIVVAEPRLAFARVAGWMRPFEAPFEGIDATALIRDGAHVAPDAAVGAWVVVESGASIGSGSCVFPGCYIGAGTRVGKGCILYPNVVLYAGVELGDRSVVQAGAVIGSDGFGFVLADTRYVKIPQLGRVRIGPDAEVGANSCIDRGALDDTVVDEGAKIDNLCQVAHNVRIGAHAIMSSQSGIAGSSSVGHHAVIGGQVGVADHCRIGDGAVLGAHTGIPSRKHVPSGETYWGSPARPLKQGKRLQAFFSRLPRMSDELKQLRSEVDELRQMLSQGQSPPPKA